MILRKFFLQVNSTLTDFGKFSPANVLVEAEEVTLCLHCSKYTVG